MEPNFDTRSFVLTAGTPLALPPAEAYTLLVASVDSDAVGISLGDSNADFGQMPYGIAVYTKGVKARIVSAVTQLVTIMFASGGVTFVDNRPPVYPVGGTSAQYVFGSGVASGLFVPAATNVSGIIVYQAYGSVAATPGIAATFALTGISETLFFMMAPAGSNVNIPFSMTAPWLLGPGRQLAWANVNATAYACSVIYKIL